MAYILVGTEASHFTGKARALLRWSGVDFSEMSATPEVYRDLIEPRVGFSVIPVLLTPDDRLIQDPADISDHVEATLPATRAAPLGPVQKFVALLVELYADEWLAIVAAHYRWAYNETWITAEFGRVALPGGSPEDQLGIGRQMAERGRVHERRLGVSEETHSGVEAHYEGFLADFSAHLRQHPFLMGQRPCLGDYALYGPLFGPLYRDPASGEVMRRLAPLVAAWVERMSGAPHAQGELIAADAVPETLHPLLKRQMAEQLPELVDGLAVFAEWVAVQPEGARAPRSFGDHEFTIGGRRGERQVRAIALWRLQRVLHHYLSLDEGARRRIDTLLDAVGGRAISGLSMPRPLEKREFRLVVA